MSRGPAETQSLTPATSNRAGIGFMVGAAALVAATSLLAKALGLDAEGAPGLHPFQVSSGRFLFAFLAISLFVLLQGRKRPSLHGANWRLHLMRSVCGWLGVTSMFGAVAQMPVADATAISFLSPVVTMGLAVFLLNERIGAKKLLAAALALTGAMLILKPATDAFQAAGLLALAAAGFMGLEAIFVKRLGDTEPAARILFINNAIGSCISLLVASLFWIWPSGLQWMLMFALGTIMVCGQALFIQAMTRSEASLVMPAFYSVLVFAALYDFLLFAVLPDHVALLGAAMIVSSALFLIGRRSDAPEAPPKSQD